MAHGRSLLDGVLMQHELHLKIDLKIYRLVFVARLKD